MWVTGKPTVEALYERSHAAHDLCAATNQGSENLTVAERHGNPSSDVRTKKCNKQFVHAFKIWANRAVGGVDDVTNQVRLMTRVDKFSSVDAVGAEGGTDP